MMNKIRVAFVYKKNFRLLTLQSHNSTYYHFFLETIQKNERLKVTNFPSEEQFDTAKLKKGFDILMIFDTHISIVPDLLGIEKLDIPVICRSSDPHADPKNAWKNHKKYKIDQYFDCYPPQAFYEYFPKEFKFKTIMYGLEPALYQNLTPFEQRIKDRILNSGNIGHLTPILRLINVYIKRNWNTYSFYKLRTECTKLPYVDFTYTKDQKYVGDLFPLLLQKYAAAIAATTVFPTQKYLEIPAAGCLTFMEITKRNYGDYLGFVDEETAIFINEKNYKDKFSEYLSDVDNTKWEKIATAGREYVLKELNNDKAADSLADLMEVYV